MRLSTHQDAVNDVKALLAAPASKLDGTRLVALIDQLKQDQKLLNRLLESDKECIEELDLSVKPWGSVRKELRQKPVSRLRSRDLETKGLMYRIIYLYYYPNQEVVILAVVHRSKLDYDDPNDVTRQRIVNTINQEYKDA